ncbi:hypothetical protein E4U16_004565 [Claviceps sp. LM84 group G4]|nr:hypothetical protein E4U16_004565 [Claviceps sp. LM84 group G4]
MSRLLHVRFKRWDGIEPDTNGEMQKVGFEQQDAQGGWGFFWPRTTNTLSNLSKCLPVAAHLAPAPAAAIVAPARAAATKLPSQYANPPPSARHWEATTGRTSTGRRSVQK